ncbi:peptide chain release factor 2 [bacterium]|nr:peptide chain release factor 2 [bacterium]
MPGCFVCATIFDLDHSTQRVSELESHLSAPDVWSNPAAARKLNQELSYHQTLLTSWREIEEKINELQLFLEMVDDSNSSDVQELEATSKDLETALEGLETTSLLSGEMDSSPCMVTIHAGAGGTDAQDWAEMMLRMYLRWAERSGYQVELADTSPGDEAGLHSATFFLTGPQPYGMMRSERGAHRLVRISPFDQARRRHTAFAKVDVLPEMEDAEVEVRTEDLKIDTYRSSGAGGQHVNKTESAIRITHIPTGIIVACQNERSQQSNRLTAMRMLKTKLFELQQSEKLQRIQSLRGENREAAWGNQIRSYVLQPYTQVKDRRTGLAVTDAFGVLDGDLNKFIRGYLEACARLGREPEPADLLSDSD